MPSFMIFGLILWAIVTVFGVFVRWLLPLSAGTLLLFMAALVIADKTNTHMLATHPYHGEISVVDTYIKSSRYGDGPIPTAYKTNSDDINWLALTIRNTDEQEHPVNLAMCSIRGPVYYDPNYGAVPQPHIPGGSYVSKTWATGSHKAEQWYLGERRMVVRLVAVASTKFANEWNTKPPVVPAAERWFAWRTPTPTNREIAYFLAFPKLRLFDDDVVEWCKFGRAIADLPQDQLEPRVEWIGDHADIPIDHVALDTEVSLGVMQAVLAAQ
jgi:hypothetical protein